MTPLTRRYAINNKTSAQNKQVTASAAIMETVLRRLLPSSSNYLRKRLSGRSTPGGLAKPLGWPGGTPGLGWLASATLQEQFMNRFLLLTMSRHLEGPI